MFDYYNSMDRYYGKLAPSDLPTVPSRPVEVSSLTPQEIGVSTNPMAHQVQAFAARVREGASKIEIGFLGAGKSSSQQPSPEAFGAREREDIRQMAKINEVKTSVHAALHGESLAGLGREGFSDQARQQALKEIERAIQFSADATRGGAIVFHTGEWMRPISELSSKDKGVQFQAYEKEDEKAPKFIVDKRTGSVNAIRKDYTVYEPRFETAQMREESDKKKLVGTTDANGNVINRDDWVDLDGNVIKKEWILDPSRSHLLFERVPIMKDDKSGFDVVPKNFGDFEKLAQDLQKSSEYKDVTAEELFFKSQISNQALQYKGLAKYHSQHYDDYKRALDIAREAKDFYKNLEDKVPKEELWKIMRDDDSLKKVLDPEFLPSEKILPSKLLDKRIESLKDNLRQVQETSAAYEAQAKQIEEQMNNLIPLEKYGLEKTADTIAQAGIMAMEYYDKNKEHLPEKIFVAPENWRPEQFGSHPDEIRKIVETSREVMADKLVAQGESRERARKLAEDHIKATIDIGHFNMWRQHFVPNKGENREERNKRFDKWVVNEMDKLAGAGVIGHLHLADNFGFDDEHLTPGQGNAPIKEFVKVMEKHGIKDFVVEQSGFNVSTTMPDTWALLGSPVYGAGGGPRMSFRSLRDQHFGYHNPSGYIVGAYAPSNEWKLWSEVPFE